MPTLAELQARKAATKTLLTWPVRVPTDLSSAARCDQLARDKQVLLAEKSQIMADALATDANGKPAAPRKQGQKLTPPRVTEIDAEVAEIDTELESLWDRMRESEGDVIIQAISAYEWQQWKDEHPPREDNQSDMQVGYGLVNVTDLMGDLGRFVAGWDDETLPPGSWDEWMADTIPPGYVTLIATKVVELQEARISVPKSSSASSATERSESA